MIESKLSLSLYFTGICLYAKRLRVEMSQKHKILIVEDDLVIAKNLQMMLKKMDYQVVKVLDSGEALLGALQQEIPDLILLDINLAGALDGIDTAQQLKKTFDIPFIFLTALSDRPTLERAKITEPQAYLIKPVESEPLRNAIEIALYKSAKNSETPAKPTESHQESFFINNHFFVKAKNRLEKVHLEDVLWLEAKDIYCVIKTTKGQYVVSHTLKKLEKQFPSASFMRVHRSYMVALESIDAIEDNNLVISEQYIPIGKTYKSDLLERLRII